MQEFRNCFIITYAFSIARMIFNKCNFAAKIALFDMVVFCILNSK